MTAMSFTAIRIHKTANATIEKTNKYFPPAPLGTVNLFEAKAESVSYSSVPKVTFVT